MVVRQLRLKRNLSQIALAKRAGVSRAYLSRLESGARGQSGRTSIDVVRRLAKALGVSPMRLVN